MSAEKRFNFNGRKYELTNFLGDIIGLETCGDDGYQEFRLPPDWGEGSIQRFDLENGMEIWKARTVFSKPFNCTYERTPYSSFGYWREGIRRGIAIENSLGYEDFQSGKTCFIPGIVYDYVALVFKLGFFQQFPEFQTVINNSLPDSTDNDVYSYRIRDIFNQMHDCPMRGLALRFFMEGKSLELLSELLHLKTAANEISPGGSCSEAETLCIQRARTIIDENLGENISLPELAALAGINTYKLTCGFKNLYGTSINAYRTKTRMEKAETLLLSGKYNISETADMLGYKSTSHFCETFKRFHNMSPGDYRGRTSYLLC
jgi:AraC-like DNA-binding protein